VLLTPVAADLGLAYHLPMPWYAIRTYHADPDALGGGRFVGKSEFLAADRRAAKREAQRRADELSRRFFVTLYDQRGAKFWITEAHDA
jgi:hypothetical protein